MSSLADVLLRFNRKERNLLIRAVLGDEQEPLQLSEAFRRAIAQQLPVLKVEIIPEEAWWSTDYHISWLAGALAYYTEGKDCLKNARHNPSTGPDCELIERNQEDIDLVIASGRDLILVEAKAYGKWDVDQLQSKLDRFDLLRGEYDQIAAHAAIDTQVQMHFLLMSPVEPKEIKVDWRRFKRTDSPIPWIRLNLPKSEPILEVSRCNEKGKKSDQGGYWQIVEHRAHLT